MIKLLLVLYLIFLSTQISAQWFLTNDGGDRIQVLYAQGDTIFALPGSKGLFITTNNAKSWECIGFEDDYLTSIVKIENDLFVASYTRGVLKSIDNGITWTILKGLPHSFPTFPWITSDGEKLFARSMDSQNYISSVYMSNDRGETWESITSTINGNSIYSISLSDNDIYLGTDKGVFVSKNQGNSWNEINNGIDRFPIFNVFISDSILFALTGSDLYRSNDDGSHWNTVDNVHSPSYMISYKNNLYGCSNGLGVIFSSDAGLTWKNINNGLFSEYALSLVSNETDLFVGVQGGVYELGEDGKTWEPATYGIPNSGGGPIYSFVTKGDTIFAGTGRGVIYSTDGGGWWLYGNNEMFSNKIYALTLSGDTIFAGTNNGLFSSIDNGQSWNYINTGIPDTVINGFLSYDNQILAFSKGSGIYSSLDNGNSWNAINTGLTNNNINALIKYNNNIIAGTDSGIFNSLDGDFYWQKMNNELNDKSIKSLAVNGSTIYAGTSKKGFYFSTDGGISWYPKNDFTGIMSFDYRSINSILIKGDTLLIGTSSGLFYSTINNLTWYHIGGINDVNALTYSDRYLIAGGTSIWVSTHVQIMDVDKTNFPAPESFVLFQNFPNPFNPTTQIKYSIPKTSLVTIKVYDILGKEVTTLVNEEKSTGNYEIEFNGNNLSTGRQGLASGIYFYRLQAGDFVETKKMILLK